MFREIKRIEKQLSEQEVLEILNSCDYGFLAIGGSGYAYGVPINYVYLDEKVYFHCASEGYKLDRIKENNKVSFTVVAKHEVLSDKFTTAYQSVIIFGKTEQAFNEEKLSALTAFIEKFSPDYIKEGKKYIEKAAEKTTVYSITIDHVTGKGTK